MKLSKMVSNAIGALCCTSVSMAALITGQIEFTSSSANFRTNF